MHGDAIAAHSLLSVSGVEAGGAAGGLTSDSVGGDGGALCTRGSVVRSSSTSERDAIGRLSEPTTLARFVGLRRRRSHRIRSTPRRRPRRSRRPCPRVPIPLSATPTTLPLARRPDVAHRALRALAGVTTSSSARTTLSTGVAGADSVTVPPSVMAPTPLSGGSTAGVDAARPSRSRRLSRFSRFSPARGAIRVRTLAARRALRRGGTIGAHGTFGASDARRMSGLGSRGALGTRGRGGPFASLGPIAPRALAIDVYRPRLALGLARSRAPASPSDRRRPPPRPRRPLPRRGRMGSSADAARTDRRRPSGSAPSDVAQRRREEELAVDASRAAASSRASSNVAPMARRLRNPVRGNAGYGMLLIIRNASAAMRKRSITCHGRFAISVVVVQRRLAEPVVRRERHPGGRTGQAVEVRLRASRPARR